MKNETKKINKIFLTIIQDLQKNILNIRYLIFRLSFYIWNSKKAREKVLKLAFLEHELLAKLHSCIFLALFKKKA